MTTEHTTATPYQPAVGNDYPDRHILSGEIHSRPYMRLESPLKISHIATLSGEGGADADRAHVARLCQLLGAPEPDADAMHHWCEVESIRFRWERHTEFSTYTFMTPGDDGEPFSDPAIYRLPEEWRSYLPGKLLVALHIEMEARTHPVRDTWAIAELFDGNTITGSAMADNRAQVWTDHQIHTDGFQRILMRDIDLDPRRAGRLIQRVLEMETYRLVAMLAFPLAKSALTRIGQMEQKLNLLVFELSKTPAPTGERELLVQLTELAIETESIVAETTYRFGAARAYHKIVERRLVDIREARLEELQMMGSFMTRRLAPAMETCETVAARLESLSRRVARAGDLLRTRVDISLEEQNHDLLISMDRRAQLQVRLQQTVEGLSVVAISYYLVSLVGYLAKGASKLGMPWSPDIVTLAALPIVIVAVWIGVKRIRRAITSRHTETSPDT
ncbi:MAG: DUF3422 domain-containing protein [Rhodospirillales bacterium]|nr:DUF3422 domain-containing protein [Rhodospirillales bacterium]